MDEMKMLGKYFCDSLCDTIEMMMGFSIEQEENWKEEDEQKEEHVSGAMILTGNRNGLLMITTKKNSAGILLSYMTGIETKDLSETELYDGLGEIVNMVAGAVKTKVLNTEYEFRLSSPFAIVGQNTQIVTKRSVKRYQARFCSDEIGISLQIFYF